MTKKVDKTYRPHLSTVVNVAICDDERAEIIYVAGLVRKWAGLRSVDVRFSEHSSAESFLFAYEDDKSINILLLDIQMDGMDGVALARSVRKANKEIQIVFITGYMEYIAEGYEVEALHYLLKPVTEEKLFAVMDRAMEKLAYNERVLFVNHAGEMARIPMYEIRYLEVRKNYVTIHAQNEYMLKKTLGEIEKELDGNFFRLGRSYIINLSYIRKVTKTDVHLAGGTTIPLPRRLYGDINRAIIERL